MSRKISETWGARLRRLLAKPLIPNVRGAHPSAPLRADSFENREAGGSLYYDGADRNQRWAGPRRNREMVSAVLWPALEES
jgi:hypothetical protein